MATITTTEVIVAPVRHEPFCLPRPGLTEPRIEGYTHYEDDPITGRSRATHAVLRCMDCGAAHYERTEK